MKMKVQLVIEDESGGTTTTDLVDIERGAEGLIGLSLAEAKALNARVQRALIDAQAREAIARGAVCSECKEELRRNGTHRTLYRTAFGRIELISPRFYTCRCQGTQRSSHSPLSAWLGSHISPELEYLEGQFAALLPYGVSARILNTVLPLDNATSITVGGGCALRPPRRKRGMLRLPRGSTRRVRARRSGETLAVRLWNARAARHARRASRGTHRQTGGRFLRCTGRARDERLVSVRRHDGMAR